MEVAYILEFLKIVRIVHCSAADMRTELVSHREQSAATSAEPQRSVPGYRRLVLRPYYGCRLSEDRQLVRFLWSVHRPRLTAYVMGQELDTDSIE